MDESPAPNKPGFGGGSGTPVFSRTMAGIHRERYDIAAAITRYLPRVKVIMPPRALTWPVRPCVSALLGG